MLLTSKRAWPCVVGPAVLLLLFSLPYDAFSQGVFVPTSNMITRRISHTATLLQNGKVLVAGGSSERPASAELYDPATDTFTQTGDMTKGRSGHSATLLPNGQVLIAGGGTTALERTAELYDPVTGTFTATGDMVTAQAAHTGTLLDNGKVLISGGAAEATAANPELYDPSTGVFSPAGTYAHIGPQNPYGGGEWGMVGAPALWLPNHLILIAGEPFAEIYDSNAGVFGLTAAMLAMSFGQKPWYIAGRTGTLLPNGKVLVAGGEHEDLGSFHQAELYDPARGEFTDAGVLTRTDHAATLLQDGTVLITGGQLSPGVVSSTEIHDPATGTFVLGPAMTRGRFFHTATRLLDGRVLIAGGYTSYPASPDSNSAELYVPSTSVTLPVVTALLFDRAVVLAGTSYSVTMSGLSLTPQTFFDIRFTSPGNKFSDVILNWQRGLDAAYAVPVGLDAGNWTITEVRPHEIETDHTGNFVPVFSTITVAP